MDRIFCRYFYILIRQNREHYSKGSNADLCLAYINSEINIAKTKYSYSNDQIKIIGLPDLFDLQVHEKIFKVFLVAHKKKKLFIVILGISILEIFSEY